MTSLVTRRSKVRGAEPMMLSEPKAQHYAKHTLKANTIIILLLIGQDLMKVTDT